MAYKKIPRKDFLKKPGWLLVVPHVLMVALVTRRSDAVTTNNELRIAKNVSA